jgi:hypothetical protein
MKRRSWEPLVKISVIGEHSAFAVTGVLNGNVVLGVPVTIPLIAAVAVALELTPLKVTVGAEV